MVAFEAPAFAPPTFTPKDPNFEARVRASFDRQGIMTLIGARMTRVEPGLVEIELPYRAELTQQHGFFHAGITSSVLTTEFKINLLAPAEGELLRALGRVVKPGRTLTVCEAEVFAVKDGRATPCAKLLETLLCLEGRPDGPGE